jgi:prepilin-type N-terminal cleavage/methylation domain-containing protein
MPKNFSKQNNESLGFTLVETLVAVSIFSIALLGLMSVLVQSISTITYAKQKMVATYLAQEGIEYIRNIRDTYVLYSSTSQNGWNAFNNGLSPCTGPNGCYFNADNIFTLPQPPMPITQTVFTSCISSVCQDLAYDNTTGTYGYTTGTDSGLSRKIQVNQVNANEINVSSAVFWKQGSVTYNVVFSENLFNWVQ